MKNYYHILGLQNFATISEVRKAYRKMALQYHPDRGGDVEKMKQINEAYDFLMHCKDHFDNLLRPEPRVPSSGFTIIVGGFEFATSNGASVSANWSFNR